VGQLVKKEESCWGWGGDRVTRKRRGFKLWGGGTIFKDLCIENLFSRGKIKSLFLVIEKKNCWKEEGGDCSVEVGISKWE